MRKIPVMATLSWAVLATLLAAPSGAVAQRDTLKPLVYLSDENNNNIYVFNAAGIQVGMIGGLAHPQGLFLDASHRLWVANYSNSDVLVFPRGKIYPASTYNDPGQNPMDVTICPNGLVFVSNLGGSISVYRQGNANPVRTLSDPSAPINVRIACDGKNNIFTTIEFTNSGPGSVDEYVGGVQSGLKRIIPQNLGFAYGLALTARGTLLVADQQLSTVTEYALNGKPTGRSLSTGSDKWYGLTLTPKGVLLAADYSAIVGLAVTFPAGTNLRQYVPQFRGSGSSPDVLVGIAYDAGG